MNNKTKHFKIIECDFKGYRIYRICMRYWYMFWFYIQEPYYSSTDPTSYVEFRTEGEALEYLTNLPYKTKVLHTPLQKLELK